MASVRILSCDPGKDNYAATIGDYCVSRSGKLEYNFLHTRMVQNTLQDLTSDLDGQLKKYLKEMRELKRRYSPTYFVAERFQNRGSMRGASGELVSMMLGVSCTLGMDNTVITASQWKNAFNRVSNLDHLYEDTPFVAHVVDSACIGLYHACKTLNVKPYEWLAQQGEYKRLVKAMERLHDEVTR